jgi:hypothetical protein
MQQYTDTDLYYLLLTFIHSKFGLLAIILAYLLLIALIGISISIFKQIAAMKTDCNEILNKKDKPTFK